MLVVGFESQGTVCYHLESKQRGERSSSRAKSWKPSSVRRGRRKAVKIVKRGARCSRGEPKGTGYTVQATGEGSVLENSN